MELKGAVAIVTGASRGIGKAICIALAKEGTIIMASARSISGTAGIEGSLEQTTREIREMGGKCEANACDITDEQDINRLIQKTVDCFGKIDILVNNAAVYFDTDFKLIDIPVEMWDYTFKVNLRGVFLCIKAALPFMIKNKKGSIINITSMAGTRTPGKRIAYGASKAGLDRLTFGLAQELKEDNIAVNALCPIGLADTPGARAASPKEKFEEWVKADDVAKGAVWLARQEGVSFTGRAITIPASGQFTGIIYKKMSDERMWIKID